MLNQFQRYGRKSEDRAVAFLKKQGYTIIQRNYRTRLGEIDIIARDKETIVFVEVKARMTDRAGSGKSSITRNKQFRITRLAQYYLKQSGLRDVKARFDVVVIQGDGETVELIRNAFAAVLA
ncbi:MAG: YraN family protein [Thermodesulfobacteriota bacterium]